MNSSGTSGNPSKIALDKINARHQKIALAKIFEDFSGLKRPLLLVLESEEIMKDRSLFNARKAGIIGFMNMCKGVRYIADGQGKLLVETLERIIQENNSCLMYGFTDQAWKVLSNSDLDSNTKEELSKKCTLVHGGGWKKMEGIKVTKKEFRERIKSRTGIKRIQNYYGMIEQTGSIFFECEDGYLHDNPLDSIIARDTHRLDPLETEVKGLAQVISGIPSSYPGHSLLTDDIISIKAGICSCGRKGKRFEVHGRMVKAEIRGCSDAYESR